MSASPSHQGPNEVDLEIFRELREMLPHRRVVFEIGQKFKRKDVAEKLAAYGEVRLNSHRGGDFYDQQYEIFKIFQPTQLPELVAPLKEEVHRQLFHIQKDHGLMISVLDNEKVAGTVFILPLDDDRLLLEEEMKPRTWFLTEEQKKNINIVYEHYSILK